MELILWLTGGFLLFGGVTKAQFERSAADDLRSVLGAGAKVRVTTRPNLSTVGGSLPSAKIEASGFAATGLPLYTEPNRSSRGKLDRLGLDLTEFDLRGLRIARLVVQIPNCRFDLDLAIKHQKFRLSRSAEGTGTVTIRASDLEKFVLKKYPALKECTFTLRDGRARVDALAIFGASPINFRLEGRITSDDGRSLRLVDAAAQINGKAAPEASARALASSLNPVLHLDKDLGLFGAVDVQTISLRDNMLIATAKTRIPPSPAWILGQIRFYR